MIWRSREDNSPGNLRIKAYTVDSEPLKEAEVTNKDDGYAVSYTYGEEMPQSAKDDFTTTITDADAAWTFRWYRGDQTDKTVDLSKLETLDAPSDAGTYTLAVQVEGSTQTAEPRLLVTIKKAELSKGDFEVTLPESLVYDGQRKPVQVSCKKFQDLELTVKYQKKADTDTAGDAADIQEEAPSKPGMYNVFVYFSGNDNVEAATELLLASFTISKSSLKPANDTIKLESSQLTYGQSVGDLEFAKNQFVDSGSGGRSAGSWHLRSRSSR